MQEVNFNFCFQTKQDRTRYLCIEKRKVQFYNISFSKMTESNIEGEYLY